MGRPASGTVGYYHVVDIWSIIRHHDYGWGHMFSFWAAIPASTRGRSSSMLSSLLSPSGTVCPEGMVTSVFLVEWVAQRGYIGLDLDGGMRYVCCVEVAVTVERLCDIWVERDLLARMAGCG